MRSGEMRANPTVMRPARTRRIRGAGTGMLALAAGALIGVQAVDAQTPAPPMAPQSSGRFTMHPADGGMLRLDTETGTMSMCKAQQGGRWVCQTLPDERAALDKEIGRLAQENRDLQAAVKRLEDLNGIPSDRNRRADGPHFPSPDKLPTPEDVDKAMTYLQSMLKKFKEKLKDFEDLDSKTPQRL